MLRIGITGGIGSGKSTVSKIFEVLGIPVYYADDASKALMNEDPVLQEKIRNAFGEAAYVEGVLNRAYLSAIVFNNPAQLKILNAIVHPATISDAERWMQAQSGPYAIKEAALIFESGAHAQLDKVIGVYAPEPLRISRVMKRDQSSREEVFKRISKQMDENIKMRLCDFVINNDEQELVIPQVIALHAQLLALC